MRGATSHKCCIVKCDLGESSLLAERYRIHATPTFLMCDTRFHSDVREHRHAHV